MDVLLLLHRTVVFVSTVHGDELHGPLSDVHLLHPEGPEGEGAQGVRHADHQPSAAADGAGWGDHLAGVRLQGEGRLLQRLI